MSRARPRLLVLACVLSLAVAIPLLFLLRDGEKDPLRRYLDVCKHYRAHLTLDLATYGELADRMDQMISEIRDNPPPPILLDWHNKSLETYDSMLREVSAIPPEYRLSDHSSPNAEETDMLWDETALAEEALPQHVRDALQESRCSFYRWH